MDRKKAEWKGRKEMKDFYNMHTWYTSSELELTQVFQD